MFASNTDDSLEVHSVDTEERIQYSCNITERNAMQGRDPRIRRVDDEETKQRKVT